MYDTYTLILQDIEKALEPVLYMFKQRQRPGEALGDFTARIGFDALRQYAAVSLSGHAVPCLGRERCRASWSVHLEKHPEGASSVEI